jgi:DNA invertase Pin-like site-specific DNA recombinase
VKDAWLEAVNIEGPLGKTIQDFLLGMIGSIAEMDSSRRSERMKLAYKARTGRWGRKGLPLSVFKKVGDLHAQGLSVREIARQVWYFSKSNNKKYLSVGAVHKIITSNKDDLSLKEDRKEGVQ